MEDVYKFGRGQWKTIEQGNELLWLMGNGIGGYSNHTVSGGGTMSFNGYLIASLNPPVSRYLVLQEQKKNFILMTESMI